MSKITVDQLKPGMVIVQITEQNGPVPIRKSGLVSSPEMIMGLVEMGVQEVEIDPAQTVEIDLPKAPVSPTQALIEKHDFSNQTDSQLSDQFNRSLFLPSVNDIKPRWQFWFKRVAPYMLVCLLGIGLGFLIALLQSGELFDSTAPQAQSQTTESVAESQFEEQKADSERANAAQATAANDLSSTAQEPPSAQINTVANDVASVSHAQQTEIESTDESVSEPLSSSNNESSGSENSISPELLAKFNQALDDTANEREPPDAVEQAPSSAPKQKVPRVDQLPAWLLTELPDLSFSAHMYASIPEQRWVIVNGMEVQEGEWITSELQLVAIQPQKVILNFKGHDFSLNALSDW